MRASASLALRRVARQTRTEQTGPLPEPFEKIAERKLTQKRGHGRWQSWIAQQLGEQDRWDTDLPLRESFFDRGNIRAGAPRKIGNPRARIDGDHERSWRSCSRSIENATRPRRRRSSSQVFVAATSSNPSPDRASHAFPVDFCARRRRSRGTSTVTLRVAFITTPRLPAWGQHLIWHYKPN
jgi:hypothetical protein